MRTLNITIAELDAGTPVGRYLREKLGFSARQVSRVKFRVGGILVNGIQARTTRILLAGDELSITLAEENPGEDIRAGNPDLLPKRQYARWAEPPAGLPPFRVLYEDDDLLAVEKPGGLCTHPSPGHYRDTLANQAAWYLGGEHAAVRIAGRLDRDTSGIVLFAKNGEASAVLAKERGEGIFRKLYLAEVRGIPAEKSGRVDVPLKKDEERKKMTADPSGKPAVTHYRVIGEREGASLLAITIEHGRTHQIRVHLSYAGYPLVGDSLYGEEPLNGEEPRDGGKAGDGESTEKAPALHLHALEITLRRPFTGQELVLKTGYPEWCRPYGDKTVLDGLLQTMAPLMAARSSS